MYAADDAALTHFGRIMPSLAVTALMSVHL
jgi:hypothetical protein